MVFNIFIVFLYKISKQILKFNLSIFWWKKLKKCWNIVGNCCLKFFYLSLFVVCKLNWAMIVQTLLIVASSLVSSHHNHHMDTTTRLPNECSRGPNIGGDNSCTPLHTTSPPQPLPFHWTQAHYTPSRWVVPNPNLAHYPSCHVTLFHPQSALWGPMTSSPSTLCHPLIQHLAFPLVEGYGCYNEFVCQEGQKTQPGKI